MVRLHVLGFDKKCPTWLSLKNPNPPGIPLNDRRSNPPKTLRDLHDGILVLQRILASGRCDGRLHIRALSSPGTQQPDEDVIIVELPVG